MSNSIDGSQSPWTSPQESPNYQEQSTKILEKYASMGDMLRGISSMSPFVVMRLFSEMMYEGAEASTMVHLLEQDGMNNLKEDLVKDKEVVNHFFSNMEKQPPDYSPYAGEYTIVDLDGEPLVGEKPQTHTFTVNGEAREFYLVKHESGAEFFVPASVDLQTSGENGVEQYSITLDGTEEQGAPIPVALLAYSEDDDHDLPLNDKGFFSFAADTKDRAPSEWIAAEQTRVEGEINIFEQKLTGNIEEMMVYVKQSLTLSEGGFASWADGFKKMGQTMQNIFR